MKINEEYLSHTVFLMMALSQYQTMEATVFIPVFKREIWGKERLVLCHLPGQ